jgi:CheY-like chemotaxis protein
MPVNPPLEAAESRESFAKMARRALIVDDEAETCELIEKILNSLGIESVAVQQSSEASEHLSRGKFAMVFVDYRMAYPDGLELTRQMRDGRYNRMTTVILMSDDRRPSALSKGFEAGASFFLYKPIDKDRLLRLVRATHGANELERRRTRRIPLRSSIRLRYGQQEIEGETVDVSMEGLLVKCSRTVPVGSSVGICLHLSSAMKPIVGAGSVVRFSGANMGIHLGRLSVAESQRLQDYLIPLVPNE